MNVADSCGPERRGRLVPLDELRQEHLAGTGWRLVRVGWNDLRDDDAALTTRLLQCLPPGTAFELTPRAWMR